MNAPVAQIDVETRSTCSLRNCGSWVYSLDPATEVLCVAYRLPYWELGQTGLWTPDTEDTVDLSELFDWIDAGGLVEAHNAWFERGIWANIMVARHGWPAVASSSWRCSAAKAAAHALPRGLADAADALDLQITKDLAGAKVMQKMTKPRKPRKAEREKWAKEHGDTSHPVVYWESPKLSEQLFAYCRQDVLAEEALSAALPDLSPEETEVYLLDQAINERGFQLDTGAITTAHRLIARETLVLNRELQELTGGVVQKATQRAQMLKWFKSEGLDLPDTQKETIDNALHLEPNALTVGARRGLELVRTLGRSSTAKYRKMSDWVCPDSRCRGGLLYHGASTGRWSGSGVQPHNFPKGRPGGPGADQEALWTNLKAGNTSAYPDVLEALSEGLRGVIVAGEGRQLYVADYASIEARVLMWLAGDEAALKMFREGKSLYCELASEVYGYPVTKEDKALAKEYKVGKHAVLGLGYQMGPPKFVDMVWDLGQIRIEEDFAQRVVHIYRSKFWRVKELWQSQQERAIKAVQRKGRVVPSLDEHTTEHVSWLYSGDFLYCTLPSGRRLAYPFPEIREKSVPWGGTRPSLTFMGVDPYSRKWKRQHTYGGSLVENITQACARDILAEAMHRCEKSGMYVPVLSVHDEVIVEAPLGQGSVSSFEALLTELPEWAEGCPIAAEGWNGTRYHK